MPQPQRYTERLLLSALQTTDAPLIYELHTNAAVQQYINREQPKDEKISLAFIEKIMEGVQKGRWFYWALRPKAAPEQLMGTICLWQFSDDRSSAEIGFDLLPQYQRQGFMQEALQDIIQFTAEALRLKTIVGIVNADNQPCIQLLTRNNFQFIHELPEEEKYSAEKDQRILRYERFSE